MSQSKAIEKKEGPCVILAGAGTGKTYTIIEKIKYLIDSNIYSPEKIVCITFSNEAANNLTLRLDRILKDKLHIPVIKTFHGFSADLLRTHGDKLNIKKDFKILDPDQAMVILHRNLRVQPINCHRYVSTIGTAKDLGIKLKDIQDYLEKETLAYKDIDLSKRLENLNFELQTLHLNKQFAKKKDLLSEIKVIKKILDMKKFSSAWNAYEKLKQKGNYLDYSDLNTFSLELLEKFPEISSEYSYVIVDEFQDTNKLQLDFLVRLASHGNITVVGDINQSIYRFRGAYKENLTSFKKEFKVKESDIFNLSKSFRSPNTVLRTAHKLISNNYQNKEESFLVENAHSIEGEKISVYELKDAKEEARKVVEIIKEQEKLGIPLEEICVMFRAHQYGRIIRRTLEENSIEYHAISKSSLLKQKSIKKVHDYLIILDKLKRKDKGGEQAWWDLIYNLDFSQKDLIEVGKAIKLYSKSKTDNPESKEPISIYLYNNLTTFKLSEKGLMTIKVMIEKIKLMLEFSDKPISELIKEIYRLSGISNEQKTLEEKEIMANLSKFYEIAKSHEDLYDSDLSNFIYYLSILEELEIDIEAAQLEESGVRLMTSHSTKGLEYKVVIITNFSQGRFPIERYINNSLIPTELLPEVKEDIKFLNLEEKEEFVKNFEKFHQMQEERRLAYVSLTRTKEKLFLTYAQEYNSKPSLPSQFLNEVSFKTNEDINYIKDLEQKYESKEVQTKSVPKFSTALDHQNFPELLNEIVGSTPESEEKVKEIKRFSPSALTLFSDCQKEFEYRYVYNMPEKKTISWEAMRLGSFVHLVLEKGVNSHFDSVVDFLHLAKELSLEEEWESVDLAVAETLIKVFFERHKDKFNEKSKTEQYLPLQLSGLDFIGFADRIDFTDSGVQIVDYKTGKTAISPKDRNWQLGFYILAAQEKYGKVRKVILDMLKLDRPIEFELDESGNAVCTSSKFIDGFNINEVKQELIDTARAIKEAYKSGFKPCTIEKNCEFCNEYVYGL